MTEQEAMQRALALAWKGWGRVAPNPLVGAVLLRGGRVVGEGFHAEYGTAHAEIVALEDGGDPRGATMVVTLEPCVHVGKMRPCTDAIIAAGVRKVIYAVADPHREAAGGAARLGEAGVEVTAGVCREEASAQNAAFLWGQVRPERPFVALKLAISLDGYLADESGQSRWVSGREARDYVHRLRAGFAALGVGRRTAEVDNPALTVRGPLEPRVAPTRVVFTRSGSVSDDLSLILTASDTPTTVVVQRKLAADTEDRLGRFGVRVVGADSLGEALAALRSADIQSILVEGGGALAGQLLQCDLVDRFYWIQCPVVLGRGVPAFGSGRALALDAAPRWVVTERTTLGADTLLVTDRELCSPES